MYLSIYTCHICSQEHRNSKTIVFFPLIHHHFAPEDFLLFAHCTVWLFKCRLFASEKEWHIWCILGVNLFVKKHSQIPILLNKEEQVPHSEIPRHASWPKKNCPVSSFQGYNETFSSGLPFFSWQIIPFWRKTCQWLSQRMIEFLWMTTNHNFWGNAEYIYVGTFTAKCFATPDNQCNYR